MILELKHLAPYLPYGLKILNKDKQYEMGFTNDRKLVTITKCLNFNDHYKPILRPLIDLTKEIEHNGEKIVPMRFIDKEVKKRILFNTTNLISPYKSMVSLFEWHFDVFGLIKAGLAIEKQ